MERTVTAGGSPMTRPLLRAVMVLGVIVTLVSGTGLFAVFSDRATTGTNDVSSGELAHAADLQVANAQVINNSVACDTFGEDLATGIFSVSDLQPSAGEEYPAHLCLRNVGSETLQLTVSAIDLADADIACTGDEAASGDITCGEVGGVPQLGELSTLINVNILDLDCGSATYVTESGWSSLAGLSQSPAPFVAASAAGTGVPLAPGATGCISLRLRYPDSASSVDIQVAQSDQVQWRFAFDGTVPSA